MNNRIALTLILVFIFLVPACAAFQQLDPSAEQSRKVPTPMRPVILKPLSVGWMLEPNPIVSQKNFSFSVQLAQLSGENTVVVYSTAGPNANQLITNSTIKLLDNAGAEYKVREIIPLSDFEEIHIGAVVFEPRNSKAQELVLEIQRSENAKVMRMPLAKANGNLDELSGLSGSVLSLFRQGYLDQEEYRISNNGSGLHKGDQVADQLANQGMTTEELLRHTATEAAKGALNSEVTPTPVSDQAASPFAEGTKIDLDLTLRVENTQSKKVQFVYIIFTEDGEIKAINVE